MKILLVVPEYPPNSVGGGGVVYKNLVKHYSEKGHKVTVFVGDYGARKFFGKVRVCRGSKVEFYYFPELPYPKKGNFVTSMPVSFPSCLQMFKLIKGGGFDVAHVHGFGHLMIDTACLYLKLLKIPYVVTFHGCPNPVPTFARVVFGIYGKTIGYFSVRNASNITAVSSYTAKNKYNIFSKQTFVIGNGLEKPPRLVKCEKVPRDFIILSVGRLVDMKGFDIVIQRLPQYKKIWKNVKYIIVGADAGFKSDLVKIAKDLNVESYVKFTGVLTKKQVYSFLKKASVVAIPSRWEPFNIFALEAMGCEKVIFTTYGGGLKQVLGKYSKAVNIYTKDIKKAYNKAHKNKSNFDPREYTWDIISEKYLSVLKESILNAK